MEASLQNPSNCEVRSVIKFLVAENVSVPEIHQRLCKVYGEGVMSIEHVRKWKKRFLVGRKDFHDEGGRSGRTSVSPGGDAVSAVRDLLESDARLTLSVIVKKLHPRYELTRYQIISEATRRKRPGKLRKKIFFLHEFLLEFFSQNDGNWYSTGLQKLESRYRKCIEKNGDYVEK